MDKNFTRRTVSVIIPAFNEEKNIEAAVKSVLFAVNGSVSDYEIIIIDDCSNDHTADIAGKIACQNHRIKVHRNGKNMGFGYTYRKGVELSRHEYISLINADNEILPQSISEMYGMLGEADIIIPFTINQKDRPPVRMCLTFFSTKMLNFLFGLNLRYYNGFVIYKKEDIKRFNFSTNSFAFQVEALVKLIKSGRSFAQVGTYFMPRKYGKSKVFHPRNVFGVLKTILQLFIDTRILHRGEIGRD